MSEEKQKRIEDYSQRSKFNRDFLPPARLFVRLPKKKAEERKKIWRRKKEEKNNFLSSFHTEEHGLSPQRPPRDRDRDRDREILCVRCREEEEEEDNKKEQDLRERERSDARETKRTVSVWGNSI